MAASVGQFMLEFEESGLSLVRSSILTRTSAQVLPDVVVGSWVTTSPEDLFRSGGAEATSTSCDVEEEEEEEEDAVKQRAAIGVVSGGESSSCQGAVEGALRRLR